MHDLVIVAILDRDLAERRLGHDLEVPLDRDPGWVEAKLEHQTGDAGTRGHAAMLAIDANAVSLGLAHSGDPLPVRPERSRGAWGPASTSLGTNGYREGVKRILVLNGPNLNRLGTREPEVYGRDSLDDIAGRLHEQAAALGVEVDVRQSNHEGHLIDWLHEAADEQAQAVILNAGGFTHTSVALRDAIAAIPVPVIEVHLSNPAARESFRRRSLIGGVCKGSISGFGASSYTLALDAAARL